MNQMQPSDEIRQVTRELGERLDRGRKIAAGTRGSAGVRVLELWRERASVRRTQAGFEAAEDRVGAYRVHGVHLAEIDVELSELLDFGVPPRAAPGVALAMSASALLRDLIANQGVESRSVNEWLTRFDRWQAAFGEDVPPSPADGAEDTDGR
ncbi:hypothetical protein ACXJJ3_42030 (plasmid) [Kribbella sp. WER1]